MEVQRNTIIHHMRELTLQGYIKKGEANHARNIIILKRVTKRDVEGLRVKLLEKLQLLEEL